MIKSIVRPVRRCTLILALVFVSSLDITISRGLIAQSEGRLFPETGMRVSGRFLHYWDAHGGLAQQGFPISNEMQEKSNTDGKMYTVQYFERAVFELHPQNAAPYDVLLSLLGSERYRQKYPAGAPGQVVSRDPNARLFPE